MALRRSSIVRLPEYVQCIYHKLLHLIPLQVMEQVEGGDLIVNSGKESRPKETPSPSRDLNAVETYEAAHKLAQVHISSLPFLSLKMRIGQFGRAHQAQLKTNNSKSYVSHHIFPPIHPSATVHDNSHPPRVPDNPRK